MKPLEEYAKRVYDRIARDPNTGCWLWTASCDPRGYGQMRFPRDGVVKMCKAHRVVYELERGAIPGDLSLDHLCRNPTCVNPDHLEPVTHKENIRRSIGAQKSRERMMGNQLWRNRGKPKQEKEKQAVGRPKQEVPDQPHGLDPAKKAQRLAQANRRKGAPKLRVVAGTAAARALGIR